MIRMSDIARAAGVSRTTVSFILSGRYEKDVRITSQIVKKVQNIANEMGYVRNQLANSVITGKNRMIAIISDFEGYMSPALKGCVEEAMKYDCAVQFIPIEEDINKSIRKAVEFRVAGIFAISFTDEQKASVDSNFFNYGIPSIGLTAKTGQMAFDQKKSSRCGTEYLLSQGFKNIVFLGSGSSIAHERENGYCEVMRENGLDVRILKEGSIYDEEDYRHVVDGHPEAVQCANDWGALNLMHYCYKAGLRVPEVFSVLGFGNIPAGSVSSPHLTTIDEPYYETGRLMFHQIYHLIEKGEHLDQSPLVGEIVRRESVRELGEK